MADDDLLGEYDEVADLGPPKPVLDYGGYWAEVKLIAELATMLYASPTMEGSMERHIEVAARLLEMARAKVDEDLEYATEQRRAASLRKEDVS